MIRSVALHDAPRLADIYSYYIVNDYASFEEVAVDGEEMARRIAVVFTKFPWLVWEDERGVMGYAYARPWQARYAYRFTVELGVYLDQSARHEGIGSNLYGQLLEDLRERGVHSVVAGIALPNPGSVGLHEKFGFEKVAHFKEVGWKGERWRDVGYWEKVL